MTFPHCTNCTTNVLTDEENSNLLTEKIQVEDMLQDMRGRCSSAEKKLSSEKSLNTALKVNIV